MIIKLPFVNKALILNLQIKKLPTQQTLGITNHTEDNYFLPFIDYDDVEYDVVEQDVKFLQTNYKIGTVVISASSEEKMLSGKLVGHYHVIGFTKFTFPEIREMLRLVRCDDKFRYGWRFQQRAWVLRLLEKTDIKTGKTTKPMVKLKKVLVAPTNKVVNKPMIEIIEKFYNINLKQYFKKFDNCKNVEIITYLT